jgi:hypothetical protein
MIFLTLRIVLFFDAFIKKMSEFIYFCKNGTKQNLQEVGKCCFLFSLVDRLLVLMNEFDLRRSQVTDLVST